MTISTTTIKNSYSGNGSTTAFAYTFPINTTSEITVIERSATGSETIKSEGTGSTNYGIVDNGASGGTVTMVTAPASGTTLVIRRNTDLTQETDYVANDPFPAETHEDALDKALMQSQELQEQLDRSFKVSRTATITTPEFTEDAATRASKTLGFDSTGNVLQTVADFLPAGGDSAMFQYSTTTADADPGSGKFRLNNATISSATEMYIDDLEFNGTDVSAWVQSWDDVAGNDTNRGRIRISKANTLDTWMVFKVTGAITDATGYSKISLVYIDSAGTFADDDKAFIAFVSSGEDGAIPGYFYKFDTGTSDADPGAGEIAFNHATYANVTEIYIDDVDANGAATQTDTETWGSSTSTIKGFIHIVDINDRSTYARFKVTAAVTDASGYNKITVVHLASNNTFSAADELSVHFTRTGLKGDTGSQGIQGNTGTAGLAMTFSNSTSDADPGAGKVALNNGTLSSVSILYVDDADDAGTDISGFVQSWDDVSNSAARGIIQIVKEGTPTTFANYKVTGAVTDASGYTKIPVTHIVSNGSFSNADGIGVNFIYSGADGSGDVSTDGTQTLTNKTLTSPKIGTSILDTNGNELLKLTATGSAINELTYANAAAGNNPTFTASGGDTNIGVSILPKGSGQVTIDNLTFPAADGSANQILTTNGSGALSFVDNSGGTDWQSAVKTSNFTAAAGEGYFVNTAGGAFEIDLPGSPSVGDEIEFVDFTRNFATANLTLDQGSLKFQGFASPKPVYSTDGQNIKIVYSGSTQGWIPLVDDDVTNETPQTYSVDFLVVAGGGGGGQDDGGGGGAGGYRTSTQASQSAGNTITVTVGDGGANRTDGSDSSVSGTGITTITSTGGGKGGDGGPNTAATGGSGGGGGNTNSNPGASGNTPSTSPSQGNDGAAGQASAPRNGGGGGGAGEDGNTDGAAHGGDGLSSSITGSAVTRAGGGGGSTRVDGNARPGGDGGGGNGGCDTPQVTATAGTANTGGGGGGGAGNTPQQGGAGGKGVVIVSMPDANYSGTTSGSPTVATGVSGKTVLTFTGSGSYVS
jgi:hypothetical protein